MLLALALPYGAGAAALPIEQGAIHLYLKVGLLAELGVEVVSPPAGVPDPVERQLRRYASAIRGDLVIELVSGSFEGFGAGSLGDGQAPTLQGPGGAVALQGYRVEAAAGDAHSLQLLGPDGGLLFRADHVHVHYDAASASLELRNADLRIAAALASRLGDTQLAGLAVGVFELSSTLGAPAAGAVATAGATGGSCTTPDFSLPVDVALIAISSVQQSALESGRVAITPSAELQNVGQSDVRWEPALDPDHPLLAWALYRLSGDRFDQIGTSAAKHAFFAQNRDCPCAGGQILWAGGCTDIYGVFTNEDRSNLAPREEITASSASWTACGSFFDPDCDDVEDVTVPADELERRLSVSTTELQLPAARYFMEAWYIVAGDVDIYNTMGWREVTPTFTGTFWDFAFQTTFANGPALDAWVAPGTLTTGASAQRFAGSEGHFEVASRVTALGGGLHRYEYAVMNFDLDRQLRSFAVPIVPGASVTQLEFGDATDSSADDWTGSVGASDVTFSAPAGTGLDWGSMARLAITVDVAAALGSVTLEPLEAGAPSSYALGAPVPLPEPATALQLLMGGLAVARLPRRRARRASCAL